MSPLDHQSTLKDKLGRIVGVRVYSYQRDVASGYRFPCFYSVQPTCDGKDYQAARPSGFNTPAERDVEMQAAFDRAVKAIAKKWGAK